MQFEEVFWKGILQPRGGVEEKWTLKAEKSAHSNQPTIVFTIEESSSQSGEMVLRVITRVAADTAVWKYIESHRVFFRDPRAFFLHWIYDAFWKLKLILAEFKNPQQLTVTLSFAQGGYVTVNVSAEVFYEGGGQPIVHLANYANRHIVAAIQDIQDSRPGAFPSEWITETKEKFYADRKAAAIKERTEQERRLQSRESNGDARWLFVDESGDLGLDDGSHHYISCGVVVREKNVNALRADLRQILQTHWRGDAPSEIHFSQLPSGKFEGVTNDLSDCFLKYVDKGVCLAGDNITFFLHLLRCEAEFHRLNDFPIRTNIADLIADKDAHPRRKLLMLVMEELVLDVGLDCLIAGTDLKIVHDRKHKDWMNRALEKGVTRSKSSIEEVAAELYGQRISPKTSFQVSASEAEPCLWLSDWIAYELGSLLRGDILSTGFQRTQAKVDFITFGDLGEKMSFAYPGGPMKRRYPDWPREIGSML